MPAPEQPLPPVVVFAAVRDEERDLRRAVGAVLAQDYAGPLTVALAVGPSTDRTWQIATEIAQDDVRVVVAENPTGLTPQGLNIAVATGVAARPDATVLVRTDGHAELPVDYVSTAVETLARTAADNVGGIMAPVGDGPTQQAVAAAMSHPVGLGGGRFHTGGDEGPAETVYLGSFRRDAFERVGGYDEHWSRAQDWELNLRLRESGGVVWFTPHMRVDYRPRGDFRSLASQFYRSGIWRREVMRRYPQTASVRYLAAPATTAAVTAGLAVGVVGAAAGSPWAAWGAAVPAVYAVGVVVASAVAGRGLPAASKVRLPAVLATMHLSWGAGFLVGRRG